MYLVSISVPLALCAHCFVTDLLDGGARARLLGLALALAFALLSESARLSAVVVALAVAVLVLERALSRRRQTLAVGVVGATAAASVVLTTSLPLRGTARVGQLAAEHLGRQTAAVAASSDPAFDRYARATTFAPIPTFARAVRRTPPGRLVLWDDGLGQRQVSGAQMVTWGFRPIWSVIDHGQRQVLWERSTGS